jgi:hypothetical protein
MTEDFDIGQLRRSGSRGGRAARAARAARRASAPCVPAVLPGPVPQVKTTAQAIATLDAQFPWLRSARSRAAL